MNEKVILKASKELAEKIPAFNNIFQKHGPPPLWDRKPGFDTLIYIILEQQVSLASAKATFDKLSNSIKVTPKNFLTQNDVQLKAFGFSQQKTRYCRIVANKIISGDLNLLALENQSSQQVKEKLMSITGIGHWTSDIYLLMVLLRPDVWPHGDRALAVAAYEVFNMDEIPSYEQLKQMAKKWKPWRSVAARLLWHHYLNTSRQKRK
ncbi:MAG: DNA-3-methyladenine glycosylase 2 family protein [Calditrichaeota bacterium]|nr:MAG: DNA-3-methyladenine glycosylase 2 family protein [Calditrichota bacterium]MBL1205109.1 DNA-3-methyladenine glycosylase 2 family protein [Calditrichota bacterium]NOG44939.1 DNA-3-methyladenine glycosylase 2 family protein [Calditrichota bacterium]